MKSITEWFADYSQYHRNKINIRIHWICVPAIFFSVVAMLASIPVPSIIQIHPIINFGLIFMILCLVFYLSLSITLSIGMLIMFSIITYVLSIPAGQFLIEHWYYSLLIFAVAWVGQFIGHKIEGKRPAFFKDVRFLLIGPLWVLSHLYGALKIKI
jgi:uncharacterized membrane protein YGL010W